MAGRHKNWVLGALIILVPAGFAVWYWYYWPVHQRRVLIDETKKAIIDNDEVKAEKSLSPLRRDYPDDPEILCLHAAVLRRSAAAAMRRSAAAAVDGSEEVAKDEFRKATEEFSRARAILNRAEGLGLTKKELQRERHLLTAARDFPEVEKKLLQLHDEQPDDIEVLEALARGTAQRSQDWQKADVFYARLIELQPQRIELLLERAKVLTDAQMFGRAGQNLREYLRHKDDFKVRLDLVDCLVNDAEMKSAENELLILKRERPQDPAVLAGLGICVRERDVAQSRVFLQQAAEKAPSSTWILNELGNTLLMLKDYDQAIAVFERILDPGRKGQKADLKTALQAHLKLSVALKQRKRPEDQARIEKLEKRYRALKSQFDANQRRQSGM
jgi:tetratricopeptide (TPR) repeat protein